MLAWDPVRRLPAGSVCRIFSWNIIRCEWGQLVQDYMATVDPRRMPGISDKHSEAGTDHEHPMLVIPRVWQRNGLKPASESMRLALVCRHVTHDQLVSIEQAIAEAAGVGRGTFDPWLALSYTGRLPVYKPTPVKSAHSASSPPQAPTVYYRPLLSWFRSMSCSVEAGSTSRHFNATITFCVHKKGLPLSSTNAQSPFRMVLLWRSQSLAIVSPAFRVDTSIQAPPDFDVHRFGEPSSKNKEIKDGIPVRVPHPETASADASNPPEMIAALRHMLRMQKVLQRIINPALLALQESTEHALQAAPDDSAVSGAMT